MRVRIIAFLAVINRGSAAALARSPPIDLRTVSALLATQHLHDLAAVRERYDSCSQDPRGPRPV